jgi:hypothetical protein
VAKVQHEEDMERLARANRVWFARRFPGMSQDALDLVERTTIVSLEFTRAAGLCVCAGCQTSPATPDAAMAQSYFAATVHNSAVMTGSYAALDVVTAITMPYLREVTATYAAAVAQDVDPVEVITARHVLPRPVAEYLAAQIAVSM